ncbi:unnamed protein product [Rotaria magnacalcarata]|uniref:CID domain-containing protein n=4 Tax=Rotaria magnacalcarata TaxID=392030 RepID=A0A816CFH4_9BILA|nr:unnamed protein product [Rotaria magnacalcarata]CAF1682591.1 unnamed protein product [Rotaria magnacalcarata]
MAGKDDYQDFKVALNDLKLNSKPLINFLTILAEEKMHNAPQIVRAIEERIIETKGEHVLPTLYVLDSIVKNLRSSIYVQLFETKLPVLFSNAFHKVDERTRSSMFKLRQTWPPFFTNLSLYNLDTRTHDIDPAWPITARVPDPAPFLQNIHLNPNFHQKNGTSSMASTDQQPITDDISQQILRLQQEDPDSNTFRTRTVIQPPISIAPPKISELASRGDTYQMIPIERMEKIRQETAHVLDIGVDGQQQSKIRKLSGKKKKTNKKRRPSSRFRRRAAIIVQAISNNDQELSSEDDTDEEPNPMDHDDNDDDDDDEPFIIKQSLAVLNGFDIKSMNNITNKRTENDVEALFGGTDKDYRATDDTTKQTITNLDADSIFEINSKCLRLAEQKYKSKELSSEEYQATLKLLQNILESEVKRLIVQQNAANLLNETNHHTLVTQTNSLSSTVNTAPTHPFQQQLLQFAQQHAPQMPTPQQQSSLSTTFSNSSFPFSGFGNDAYRHVMQILATVGAPSSYTSSYNFLPYIPPLPPAPPSFTLVQNAFQSQAQQSSDQQIFSARQSPPMKRLHEESNSGPNNLLYPNEDNKRLRYDPVTGRAARTRNFDEENVAPVPSLIDANINMLKKKYIGIVQQLYVGKFQCRICGLRFTAKQKSYYTHHLDWHYLENKHEKELGTQTATLLQRSRIWYSTVQEWTIYEENIEEQIRTGKFLSTQLRPVKDNNHLVHGENIITSNGIISCPATGNGDGDDDRCYVCHDPFENFFDDNREEWHLKDAIRIDGKTYHPICYQDVRYETTSEQVATTDLCSDGNTPSSSKLDMNGNSNLSCDTQTNDPATTIKTTNDENAIEASSSLDDLVEPNSTASMSLFGLVKTIFVKKEDIKPVENIEQIPKNEQEVSINTETVSEEIPCLTVNQEPESETQINKNSEEIRTILN